MAADRDLVVFYRSLAEMLRAGVVASEAVGSCAHVLPEADRAARFVAQGQPLSAAFARFPKIFPADQIRLLQVAESAGSIDVTLADLSDYAAEIIRARRTVVSGLTLPAAVLHIAAFVIPLPTLIVGTGLTDYLISSLGFLAVLWGIVGVVVLFERHASPKAFDAVLRRLPVLREAWRELEFWRMASALRMLARTSLGVPASLRYAADVSRSAGLAAALNAAATSAEQRGEPASVSLQASGVFPPDVIALWRNGERTGGLDATFARLAARFAESFQARVQSVAVWFPRLVYFIVCLYLVAQIMKLAGGYLGRFNEM